MIAVGGFDGVDVSSTEFSMWQSPISDQASKVGAGECIFFVDGGFVVCGYGCFAGRYVRSGVAVVGVDDSCGGDEEVISTGQVCSTA
jgi:hypothetical protein